MRRPTRLESIGICPECYEAVMECKCDEANDSPLDDATREEILSMVFDSQMERASVGMIWERLRRKYGALLPAQCLTYYSENDQSEGQPPSETE